MVHSMAREYVYVPWYVPNGTRVRTLVPGMPYYHGTTVVVPWYEYGPLAASYLVLYHGSMAYYSSHSTLPVASTMVRTRVRTY